MDMANKENNNIKEDILHKEVMAITSNKEGKEYPQKNLQSQNYLLCLHNHQ